MKEKILVLGGNGFMGKNIQKAFENSDYEMFYESRRTNFDLSDYECSLRKLKEINPDIIIFAAAHVGSIKYVNENAANVVHDNSEMYLNLYKSVANFNKDITIINSISNCSYPGIIDIQQPYIFQRFYRIENEVHILKGTGLGLAIVETILSEHKAEINVISRYNIGSAFWFDLLEE